METNQSSAFTMPVKNKKSNGIVIKMVIVAIITLLMLIPTAFVSELIIERQHTHNQNLLLSKDKILVEKNITSINYEKSMRTTKYSILVIGLTFAVFFLIELLHKKPVHPVQYILVGFALAIFYLLVLSLGEYILFDYAYIIAAIATITLITLYVKSHFNNWKASSALGGVLTTLYGFILVLISLENTALIIGSIGLFILLAVVMYVTRNINWYNLSATQTA